MRFPYEILALRFQTGGSMKQLSRFILVLTTAILLTACGKEKTTSSAPAFQNPANRAAGEIQNSFTLTDNLDPPASSPLGIDKTKIMITKSALEKEFLLQASFVPQEMFPNFHGQKSRIVFFRRIENKLYLIEASKGLLIAREYPQTLVLAEFPIAAENDQNITLDFNSGMNRLFFSSDWRASDFEVRFPNVEHTALKASLSYIERAFFSTTTPWKSTRWRNWNCRLPTVPFPIIK